MMRNRATMIKGRAQNIEEPCNTVGAHLAKVSLNSTDPVLMEGGRYRRFTPREVARIQSFPDTFKLIESESAQYIALGNAIPPVMFWYVMRAVKLALEQQLNDQARVIWTFTPKDDLELSMECSDGQNLTK